MDPQRIVVVGAAGEMARVGIERLAAHTDGCTFGLYDLDEHRLRELAGRLAPDRVDVGALDLFDSAALERAIAGSALVVLGAGPYIRTAPPVMRACIAAGVDYLDFDDDIESTQDAFELDAEARRAGVALFIGCGASPGLTNVLAVDAASRLDDVEEIDVCWVAGDEGARPYGRAVIEHVFHIAAGTTVTWRDGRHLTVETFVANEVVDLGGGIGRYRLYETAHPEAVTLPRRFPAARSIRVLGGAHPQPMNGLVRGISVAVERGALTVDEAVDWFQAVTQDENGSLKGWRHALGGMLGQVRRGESSLGELGGFLWNGLRKRHAPFRGALMARSIGTLGGSPATAVVRSPKSGPDTYLASSMGAVTGTCLAAFVTLALEAAGDRDGVLAPEDWVHPPTFYGALARVGVPQDELPEAFDSAGTELERAGTEDRA